MSSSSLCLLTLFRQTWPKCNPLLCLPKSSKRPFRSSWVLSVPQEKKIEQNYVEKQFIVKMITYQLHDLFVVVIITREVGFFQKFIKNPEMILSFVSTRCYNLHLLNQNDVCLTIIIVSLNLPLKSPRLLVYLNSVLSCKVG